MTEWKAGGLCDRDSNFVSGVCNSLTQDGTILVFENHQTKQIKCAQKRAMGKADSKGCKAEIVHDFMQGTMHEIRRMN